MDKYLFGKIAETVPDFNPILGNGIVTEQMKETESYIDQVWQSAAKSFPPGLKYLGPEKVEPLEAYIELTRKRYKRQSFDYARNDVYMVKYILEYTPPGTNKTEKLKPIYMLLPYVGTGGTIHIRGSLFVINPVLADKLFSVDKDSIFVPITRDKLIFERLTYSYIANNQREFKPVVWGSIYHAKNIKKGVQFSAGKYKIKMFTTLAHYLFAKYGVTAAFKKFTGSDIVFGDNEINEDNYPSSDWVICHSTGLRPQSLKGRDYVAPSLRIAIRKDDYNLTTQSFITAIFYVADHWPDRVLSEYLDSRRLWKILLGHIIFKNNTNEGKLVEDIDTHLDSIDNYIDAMMVSTLHENGVFCNDIYELFVHIIENMSFMVVNTDVSNLYQKRLVTLRYVLLDIVKSIFNFNYYFTSKGKKELTVKTITTAMERTLKTNAILWINSGHGEVSSVSNPGDNAFIKLASRMVRQTEATGNNNSRKGAITDPSRVLHASHMEVGSFVSQPKFDPTGQSTINPYLNVDVDGTIKPNPRFKDLIDSVQAKISRN